ncbi:MAG TPA: hypothetical protein VI935_08600 [Thermodesulfobacteriota bacterium]|nr:hypothetical protein [Thermodesulfobacteriota bacterium]
MGLIDEIRKKRDSWMGRLEDHRQDEGEYEDDSMINSGNEEEEILRKRRMVGVFTGKERVK